MRILCLVLLLSFTANAANVYRGQFSLANSSGGECDKLFAVKDYESRLFLTGSAGTTAVLHFHDPAEQGFFHNVNLVGNNGGFGDILVGKEFELAGLTYRVKGDGYFDHKFIYLDITVEVAHLGSRVCTGTAQYSGF